MEVYSQNNRNISAPRRIDAGVTSVYTHPSYGRGIVLTFKDAIVDRLFRSASISSTYREDFIRSVLKCVDDYERLSVASTLGPYPERKFLPYQDSIVEFLREVWGPWLKAGELTRPILRKEDPKAYMALANFLRHNDLPRDINIPTKSEALGRELPADADTLKEAARRFHTANARANRARRAQQKLVAP